MAKLVSKTYGDALFEVALEKNQLDEFLDEVKAAQTAIEENKELFKLMSHPKIVKEEKIKDQSDRHFYRKSFRRTCWTSPHDRG